MATNIEKSIKLVNPRQHIRQLNCVLPQLLAVLQEVRGDRVVLEHLDGAGVEGCLAALG